ncbi:glycosyltransferase family 4 protein [Kitasatospora phosalacinea]|uniref:glycosyltransferase family 4 protein n=1 Tax=Kitasatospora phosalacinea TaxID=2065 RepID=UPI003669E90A
MIVHVTDVFAPRVGGIETQVAGLARAQAAAGERVHVLTTAAPPPGGEVARPFRVHRVAGGVLLGSTPQPLTGRAVHHLLDTLEPDVVHAHLSAVSPCAWRAVSWASRRGRPAVASVHSLWGDGIGALYRAVDRSAGWSPRVAFAPVSAVAGAPVRRAFPTADVTVVPNGIDPRWWRVDARPERRDGIHVVSVGRLVHRRRPLALLDVLRAAHTGAGPRLRATIVGSGPLERPMERYLRRHGMTGWVRLAGPTDRVGVRALLADADVYLNAAAHESFGIAALEARTSGLPVVALDGTGTGEFITHGREGLLAADTLSLADAVHRLAADHRLRGRISAHNRAHPPPCTWPDVLAAFDRCYRRPPHPPSPAEPDRRSP